MTYIEDTMQGILESMHVNYIRSYYIDTHEVDFFLPDHNIIIECDGECFHKNKWKTEQRDREIMNCKNVNKIMHFRGLHIYKHTKEVRKELEIVLKKYKPRKCEA